MIVRLTGRSRSCPPTVPARPSAQGSFARPGRYPGSGRPRGSPRRALPLLHRSYEPCARPKPSARLGFLLVHAVFAGCCQPLLGDGPSRRYLCDPRVGARTHTPPHFPAAPVRCFTENTGLTPLETGSARGFTPTQQLRWGAVYRGCSHSITFGLLRSLDLQIAPTATPKGAEPPGLSHHAEPGRLPDPGSGVASCPTRTTDTAGLSPAGLQHCRLLPPAHAHRRPSPAVFDVSRQARWGLGATTMPLRLIRPKSSPEQ